MRKVTWLRFGVAASLAIVGAVGAMAAGCSGDDDDTGTPAPGKDSGKDTTPATDAPSADTSTDTGPKDAGPPHAKLILVHGSPDVPAIRVCFGTGKAADGSDTTVQPLAALPDDVKKGQPYPGLFPGTGGAFPDLTDLEDVAITAFVVLADKITAETDTNPAEATCNQLVGTTAKPCTGAKCLAAGQFIPLPTIPAKTFLHGNTYLLSAVGCLPGEARGVAMCGAGYNATTGNVHVQIDQLDTVFTPDGGAGAQFAHRSSAYEGAIGAGVVPGFFAQVPIAPVDAGPLDAGLDADLDAAVDADAAPIDAGPTTKTVFIPFAGQTKFADPATTAANATIQDFEKSKFGLIVPNPDGGSPTPVFALDLGLVQLLSTGNTTPTYGGDAGAMFKAGETFTFVLLGDPVQADAGPTRGQHVIAFPNHIVPPVLGAK
jgi:hypothetical protein